MTADSLRIVFAVYPGVTHLDFTGPHQFLSRLPGAQVTVACLEGGEMEADGLTFAGLTAYRDIEACDLLCIPGGFGTARRCWTHHPLPTREAETAKAHRG